VAGGRTRFDIIFVARGKKIALNRKIIFYSRFGANFPKNLKSGEVLSAVTRFTALDRGIITENIFHILRTMRNFYYLFGIQNPNNFFFVYSISLISLLMLYVLLLSGSCHNIIHFDLIFNITIMTMITNFHW